MAHLQYFVHLDRNCLPFLNVFVPYDYGDQTQLSHSSNQISCHQWYCCIGMRNTCKPMDYNSSNCMMCLRELIYILTLPCKLLVSDFTGFWILGTFQSCEYLYYDDLSYIHVHLLTIAMSLFAAQGLLNNFFSYIFAIMFKGIFLQRFQCKVCHMPNHEWSNGIFIVLGRVLS